MTDEEIIQTVVWIRAKYGACTYKLLASELDRSVSVTYERVRRLINEKRLAASHIAGSIRPVG